MACKTLMTNGGNITTFGYRNIYDDVANVARTTIASSDSMWWLSDHV